MPVFNAVLNNINVAGSISIDIARNTTFPNASRPESINAAFADIRDFFLGFLKGLRCLRCVRKRERVDCDQYANHLLSKAAVLIHLQPPFSSCTPSSTRQNHLYPAVDGRYIHPERSLVVWASVPGLKPGASRISTKTIPWVAGLISYVARVDDPQDL